jgi:hypothetical protein
MTTNDAVRKCRSAASTTVAFVVIIMCLSLDSSSMAMGAQDLCDLVMADDVVCLLTEPALGLVSGTCAALGSGRWGCEVTDEYNCTALTTHTSTCSDNAYESHYDEDSVCSVTPSTCEGYCSLDSAQTANYDVAEGVDSGTFTLTYADDASLVYICASTSSGPSPSEPLPSEPPSSLPSTPPQGARDSIVSPPPAPQQPSSPTKPTKVAVKSNAPTQKRTCMTSLCVALILSAFAFLGGL